VTKSAHAPKNFYTATQAIKRLNIPRATFFYWVKIGKIKRVVPQGYTEGYYPKADINKLALEREMFSLQYATDSSIFRQAEEKDVQGIYELGVALFGTATTPSYEMRLACWKQNPQAYYVVEQDGFIVGYLGLIPMREEAIAKIMDEEGSTMTKLLAMRTEIVTPENILQFKPGEADNIFLIIGVRQGLSRSRYYGMKLISGGYEILKDFARRGIITKRLYATSRTPDGVRISRGLGFEEKEPTPGNAVHRFQLDLETTNSPIFEEYKEIVRQRKQGRL
jgi:hypothetical protein